MNVTPARLAQRPDVMIRRCANAVLLLPPDGAPVHLNYTAALVWDALRDGVPADQVAELVAREIDAKGADVAADVERTIDHFGSHHLTRTIG